MNIPAPPLSVSLPESAAPKELQWELLLTGLMIPAPSAHCIIPAVSSASALLSLLMWTTVAAILQQLDRSDSSLGETNVDTSAVQRPKPSQQLRLPLKHALPTHVPTPRSWYPERRPVC